MEFLGYRVGMCLALQETTSYHSTASNNTWGLVASPPLQRLVLVILILAILVPV